MGCTYSVPELVSKYYPALVEKLPSMEGKVVAITGTTSGTGLIAARALAGKGATLLLLNRESSRSAKALADLKEKYPEAKIDQVACDLQNFESVRSAAKRVAELHPEGIDVLCNNAGVMALKDKATVDSYDVQMQTNHLSHFLLTAALFPLLQAAAKRAGDARIVNHSSIARFGKPLDAKYLGKNGGNLGGNTKGLFFGGARWKRYQQTKLANALFTYALAEKLKAAGSQVKSTLAHPGYALTELATTTNADGGMSSMLGNIMARNYAQSQEDGACGIITCMAMPDVENGDFYGPGAKSNSVVGPAKKLIPESALTDPDQMALLWTESEKAVGPFTIN